jgi:hypothetical protein
VRSRVAFARRGLRAVRLCQAGLLASGVLTLALALAVADGAPAGAASTWGVALVDAGLVFLTWALAMRVDDGAVARLADRRLGFDGALVTAFEAEGRERAGELAGRLAREVAASTSARELRAAVLPTTAPLLVLPFAGAALLFLAMEEARTEPDRVDLAALVEQLEQGLGELRDAEAELESGAMGAGERHELGERLRRAAGQGRRLEQEAEPEALADLDAELAELAGQLPPGEAGERMREDLDRARAALDAARLALGDEREPAASGAGEGGAEAASEGAPEAGSAGDGGPGLAEEAADGRMFGPDSPEAPPLRADDAAVLGLPAWPEAYEGLVRRWVEAEREFASPR